MERNVLPLEPSPVNYDLHIKPNFDTFEFDGDVDIELAYNAEAPMRRITFNASQLTFVSGQLFDGSRKTLLQAFTPDEFAIDGRNDRASLDLVSPHVSGIYVLHIVYRGVMNDKLQGFYRSKYTVHGAPAHMGTTQFEACDARKALPCWDEPARKATFDVTLTGPADLLLLSNMPEKHRVDVTDAAGAKLRKASFYRTPIMSTYLLAWTIGHLEYIEAVIPKTHDSSKSTIIRVYAPEGKVQVGGTFALEVAVKTLPLYEKFFGSDYLLDKCDLLAIPDFAAGAMENWGLITFRESSLLCDESSSVTHRQYVALVVAHELAHQWFGNLVTMDWWKELWLNESFATWIEYWAVDTLFPSWQVFTQFVNDETGRAYDLDALESSHPVEVDLVNAEQVDEIFDAISYSKGGSILRMVVEYIGLDAFRRGMEAYLKHFAFRNARSADLWDFLGRAANVNLTGLLDSWILKQGYPVLRASRDASGVRVTQNRFLARGPAPPELDTTLWEVPVKLRSGTSTNLQVLSTRVAVLPVPTPCSPWVKVNADQTAFCRVLYDDDLLQSLCAAIDGPASLTVLDRLGLMLDYHAFSAAGLVSGAAAMRIFAALHTETDMTVWCAATRFEKQVKDLLAVAPSAAKAKFRAFALKTYAAVKSSVGTLPKAGESALTAMLRGVILSRLVALDDTDTVSSLAALFTGGADVSADIRPAVYAAALRLNGRSAWAKLKTLHETVTDATERARCLRVMPTTTDPALLEETLTYVMSPAVRTQDAGGALVSLAGNDHGAALFVSLLTNRWKELYAKFPFMVLARVIKSGIGSLVGGAEVADQCAAALANVTDDKERASVERSFQQGIETLRLTLQWRNNDVANLIAFLDEQ